MTEKILQIGESQIELLFTGDEFVGFGTITIGGVPIRANLLPLRPLLLSVDGVAFGRFTLAGVTTDESNTTLLITAQGVPTGQSLYLDHLGIQTARFAGRDTPKVTLRWVLTPQTRVIDRRTYKGLSWHYNVDGGPHVFFDLSEQGSWEIGGLVEGNRLLYQGEHLPPEIDLTADMVIDSTWMITDRTPCRNEVEAAIQETKKLHPLCAVPLRVAKNQPFDFLAHRSGSFTTFFSSDMEYVGCAMLKKAGQSICPWQERYRFAETSKFTTPERFVLFAKTEQPRSRVQIRNDWTRVYDEVGNGLRAAHHLPHFLNPTCVGLCTWYCWEGLCAKEEYLAKASRHFELLAKTFMPLFSEMGFTAYYLHPPWKSAIPQMPHCAVDRFEPDPVVGGWGALQMLNEAAAKAHIRLYPWVSMHLSERSSVFIEHPEWKIKARDTYNYTPGFPADLAQTDLAGGYADYLFEMLRQVRERAGVSGLFFDTLCTHALHNIAWHRQSRTNVKAVADLLGRLCSLGYEIGGETITPFVRSMRGEDVVHADFRFKQDSEGNSNASRWANYKLGLVTHLGDQLATPFDWQAYYICLANRNTPMISFTSASGKMVQIDKSWVERIRRVWPQEATRVNQDYNTAAPFLFKRILLEDDAGVLWEDVTGTVQHLFCFKPMRYSVRAKKTVCLTMDTEIVPPEEIVCEPYHTYRITCDSDRQTGKTVKDEPLDRREDKVNHP